MGNIHDLSILLALIAAIALWLKLSAARERAAAEARQQCERHGLQMLDESVGLRAMRLRRTMGHLRLERCYGFEVSIDGADREQALLWMRGDTLSELRLPTVVLMPPEPSGFSGATTGHRQTSAAPMGDSTGKSASGSNVIPLRPRRPSREDNTLH